MHISIGAFEAISPIGGLSSDNQLILSRPEANGSSYKCIEPDYKEHLNPRTLRRMSRVMKMGAATASKTLKSAQIENPDGIITATGLGCVEDTVSFLSQMTDNQEALLNPTAFIQSTHNTVAGQIALTLGCKSINLTFTQKQFSFETALLEAIMMLEEMPGLHLLVGATDEMTGEVAGLIESLGCTNSSKKKDGYIIGEGAAFFAISDDKNHNNPIIKGFDLKYGLTDCNATGDAFESFIAKNGIMVDSSVAVLHGANGSTKYDEAFGYLQRDAFKAVKTVAFKDYCGEYDSATAFALWLGCGMLSETVTLNDGLSPKNILIHNRGKMGGDVFIAVSK
jgi:hypothetical protein